MVVDAVLCWPSLLASFGFVFELVFEFEFEFAINAHGFVNIS